MINKTLHPRNTHVNGYDFPKLIKCYPELTTFIQHTPAGEMTIDYSSSFAVKALNASLLKCYYGIQDWDIPEGYLCPPVPGRADYIHYIYDLLEEKSTHSTQNHSSRRLLDIGTGANGIYSLLASSLYGWHCVASDINVDALKNVDVILHSNMSLRPKIELRQQHDKNKIFNGIVNKQEHFDISVCNPPFHTSLEEATKGNIRKSNNLERTPNPPKGQKISPQTQSPRLNFGGQEAELFCKGGERLFLKKMIKESLVYSAQCRWFTTLVSKKEHIKPLKKLILKQNATTLKTIEMQQGKKQTRILAWSYQ